MIVCPMEKGFTYFLPSNSSVPPYSYSSNEKSGFMTRSTTALRSQVVEPAAERMTVLSNASSSMDCTLAGSVTSTPSIDGMPALPTDIPEKARLPMYSTLDPMVMERTWLQHRNASDSMRFTESGMTISVNGSGVSPCTYVLGSQYANAMYPISVTLAGIAATTSSSSSGHSLNASAEMVVNAGLFGQVTVRSFAHWQNAFSPSFSKLSGSETASIDEP